MRNTSSKVVDFTEPNTCGAWKVTYILKNPMALETSFILFPREIPQRFAIKQLRLWFCADATSEKKKNHRWLSQDSLFGFWLWKLQCFQ